MLTQPLQLDLFINDLKELEQIQKEASDKKKNKQLRFAFHLLADLEKQINKNPQASA